MSEGVHVVLLPCRMRSAEEMRTGYVKAERACMDGVHLRPILPGQSRRELYCPHCQASSCPFGHAPAAEPEPAAVVRDSQEGDWLTLGQAAALTGRTVAVMYSAIYYHRVRFCSLNGEGARLRGGKRNYRLYRPDVVRRYGRADGQDQEEAHVESLA